MVLVHLQYSVTIFADKITFSHLTSCIQCSFEDMSFHTRADVHVLHVLFILAHFIVQAGIQQ